MKSIMFEQRSTIPGCTAETLMRKEEEKRARANSFAPLICDDEHVSDEQVFGEEPERKIQAVVVHPHLVQIRHFHPHVLQLVMN